MKAFDYYRPTSLEEACRILSTASGEMKALAGGTDLLVKIKSKTLAPGGLVSLRDVPGLSFINFDPAVGLSLGSTMLLREVEFSPLVISNYPALAQAAATIGSVQVRNRATIGGNICNAAPSADTLPVLIAYQAAAVISDGKTERRVPLEAFFTGPGETVLQKGEILRAVQLPPPVPRSFSTYLKATRSSMDIAMVAVGLMIWFEPASDVVSGLRMVLGAVAPTPMRALALENLVRGKRLDEELIDKAVKSACHEACPITDVRSTEGYRNTLVYVYAREALEAARAWLPKGGLQ